MTEKTGTSVKQTARKEHKPQNKFDNVAPDPALGPIDEMERWFKNAFPLTWMNRWGWPSWGELTRPMEAVGPRVNVIDRDDEIVVLVEVPGIKKEDLNVSVTENSVTIKGSSRREEKEENGDYYRCEIASGSFARTFSLPGAIDTEKVTSSFDNGVLELKLAKLSKARRRQIKLD